MTHTPPVAAAAPIPMTDSSTHDLMVDLLRNDWGAEAANLRLLDAPCGAGALSVRIRELGFRVACCDIDPGHFTAEGFDLSPADLNTSLPYDDGSFDIVASVAGLQRLSQPDTAIAEFYRVLKPGGTFYLVVPNFASLRRRVHFLLYGSLGMRFDHPEYIQTLDRPQAQFRFPILYPRVERIVKREGFDLRRVVLNKDGWTPYLWAPLSGLIRVASLVKSTVNPDKYPGYARGSTFGMLRARSYVMIARRPK